MTDSRNPNVNASHESDRALRDSRVQTGVVQNVVEDGVVRIRIDDINTIEAALPLRYGGTPQQGDLVYYRRRSNGVPQIVDIESEQRGAGTGGLGPTTIDEYATYLNNADLLIAADDFSSRSIALASKILDSDAITTTKASDILSNEAIVPHGGATVVSIDSLYTNTSSNDLSATKAVDIALVGGYSVSKLTAAIYGLDGQSNELLSASQAAQLVADGSGLSVADVTSALAPYDGQYDIYYDKNAIDRLSAVVSDGTLSPSRIRSLYQTGNVGPITAGEPTDDTHTGWQYGIFLTKYAPADAATDLDTGYHTDSDVAEMVDNVEDAETNGYYTTDELASIFDSNNLTTSRAVVLFGNDGHAGRAATFGSSNLSTTRSAAIWNEAASTGTFDVTKTWEEIIDDGTTGRLASSIDDSNLSETNAESAWDHTVLEDAGFSKMADVLDAMSNPEKPLVFGEDLHHTRTANPYSNTLSGIGGDDTTLWASSFLGNDVMELDPSDFSLLRSSSAPYTYAADIGGDSNTIWHADNNSQKVYELDPSDFSVVSSADAPGTGFPAIGGDSNSVWFTDRDTYDIYELDPSDLSTVIQSVDAPVSSGNPRIGGNSNVVWFTSGLEYYELDPSDLSVVNSNTDDTGQVLSPSGIGGTENVIYGTEGTYITEVAKP
jgi:hypothetical protein